MTQPIWTPDASQLAQANLTGFISWVNAQLQLALTDYASLHEFSIKQPGDFWRLAAKYCGVRFDEPGVGPTYVGQGGMKASWFPGARLNIARTLLAASDGASAVVSLQEDGTRREWSFGELREVVAKTSQAMVTAGVSVGDRVASLCPSVPETVAAMLATLAVGAVWAACPPELGVAGTIERLGQIAPKFLFVADGYLYGGKRYDLTERAQQVRALLPTLQTTVLLPVLDSAATMPGAVRWDDFVDAQAGGPVPYTSLPFDHPGFILFSSGTTGAPKCIIHGTGGPLLENLKALALQFDVKPGDRVYFPCNVGWMVWNVMTFALGCGASIVLYDGAAHHQRVDALVKHTADEKVTLARWAAPYVSALAKAGVVPAADHDLSYLKTLMCNGSVFAADGYRYVYEQVKENIHLVSPSGGTDSFGSLVSGNPIGAVWPGEIQCAALGFAVDVFDADGKSLRGQAGELVITQPFPSMPLAYVNDDDGARYRSAYFSTYPDVWRHGDWAEFTDRRGILIHGRSDSTLNAKGIRIGTSDIYRQLVDLSDIEESVVVAQDWEEDARVVLFVKMVEGAKLDDSYTQLIKQRLREKLSPRHVPARILQVADIPRTVNGKVSEAAVRAVIHGRVVSNASTLANPESLSYFRPEQHTGLVS